MSYYNASHKTISSDTTYRSTSFWTDLLPYKTTFFGLQPFTQTVEYQLEMKISVLLAATVTAKKNASWQQKEWEVQDAYFAGKEVVLSDPSVRSNKQWHDCGDKPPLPVDGRDVKCYGAYCAAVCPIGWRSRGRWRIKCQADNTWSHSKFSPCITCPDMSGELDNTNAVSQTTFRKNLPVTQFFCPYATHQLKIGDQVFKMGAAKRNVKCQCRNGQNGDPAWKKSCAWEFKGQPFSISDVQDVECKFKFTTTTATTTSTTPVPNTRPPCLDTFRVETNYDCAGNDIQRGISLEGDDHRACEELCRETDNCVGYTWHGRTSNWSECWLKNKMANCRPKDSGTCNKGSCITGFLNDDGSCKGPSLEALYSVETNYDCTGGDITHIQVNGKTDEICQEKCEANDDCVGYTWSASDSETSWCHLKKNMVNCRPVPAGQCGGPNGSWKRTCFTAWRLSKATPPNACDGKFEVSTHTDCSGNDITKIVLAGADHTVCAAKCEEDGNCVGYTWHGRNSGWSDCWIKHAVKNCRAVDAGQCSNGTCISGVLSDTCTAQETGKILKFSILISQKIF